MSDDTDLADLRALVTAASEPSACPTADVLARAAAGELSASERRALADHLATCASCSEEYRVAVSLGEWARRTSSALDLPGAGRRAIPTTRWPMLAAAAALFLVAGLTAALVVWSLWLRNDNTRLAAALDDSTGRAAAQSTDTHTREITQAAAIAELRSLLADARAPALNVPIIDLLPRDASRGASSSTTVRVPAGARDVAFVITTPSDPAQRDHELEIVGPSGERVWRGAGLLPNAERTFTVTVPRALLPAGVCRLRLLVPGNDGPRTVAEYAIRVEP